MLTGKKLKGGVLSTVVVVAVLMLLVVMAVLSLWETDFLLFSRANYMRIQRDNIESALAVYCNDPEVIGRLDVDSTLLLFDSVPSSRMKMMQRPWGLYEVLTMESGDGGVSRTVMCGLRQASARHAVLWYRNNKSAVTLTGKSYVKGHAYLPDKGIIYGQMRSVFFSGDRLHPNDIRKSEEKMTEPLPDARSRIQRLFDLSPESMALSDSLSCSFRQDAPLVIAAEGDIDECRHAGNIVIRGGTVRIGAAAKLYDVIVVADQITVEEGFRGSCQLFARDTIRIEPYVTLEYPSGLYSQNYAELADGSEVNGYVIVDFEGKQDIMQPAFRKSRLSKVLGLLFCRGQAQVQGIVSGAAYLDKTIYYSPQGYYQNLLYDVALLENSHTGYPLWLDDGGKRKPVKWVE